MNESQSQEQHIYSWQYLQLFTNYRSLALGTSWPPMLLHHHSNADQPATRPWPWVSLRLLITRVVDSQLVVAAAALFPKIIKSIKLAAVHININQLTCKSFKFDLWSTSCQWDCWGCWVCWVCWGDFWSHDCSTGTGREQRCVHIRRLPNKASWLPKRIDDGFFGLLWLFGGWASTCSN